MSNELLKKKKKKDTDVASMRKNINWMDTLLKLKYPGDEEIWDALTAPKVAKEEKQ